MHNQRKVFIDCGSNVGDTIEMFLKKFDSAETYDIFAFEPNQRLTKKYHYENTVIIEKAVWIKDESKDFYVGRKNRHATNSRIGDFIKGRKREKFKREPITVDCIDFSSWIKNNLSKEDYIIVKFDIEGCEYDVLQKMIKDNSMTYINKIYIEFHHTHEYTPSPDGENIMKLISDMGIDAFANVNGGVEFKAMFR